MSRPPDFVGVGVQAAGVAWWWSLLVAHPAVRPPAQRELHFFDPFCSCEMEDADIARYHALFPPAGDGITGEWTPRYMHDAWTPRLLHRAAPDARLLAMLRDPIDRYRSGVEIQQRVTPGRRPHLIHDEALFRSRYALQLRRLLELYGSDRLLVLQYERCRRDPAGEYARTLRFLGVDDSFRPHALAEPPPDEPLGLELWPDIEADLRAIIEPDVRELVTMVPDLDLGLWPNFTGGPKARLRSPGWRPTQSERRLEAGKG